MISRIAESFSCTPSVAQAELERDERLVITILELRAFADAKYAIDRDAMAVKVTPMVQKVMIVDAIVAGMTPADAYDDHPQIRW